jgi:hypothetical protein
MLAVAAGVLASPGDGRPGAAEPDWGYQVAASSGGAELGVEARFAEAVGETFVVDEGLARFVEAPEVRGVAGWAPAGWKGDTVRAAPCAAGPCRLRYRFRLAEAARAIRETGRALAHNGALLAPPSSWLLRPLGDSRGRRYRFEVATPPGTAFVTGVFPSPAGGFEAGAGDLEDAPYSGFGPFETDTAAVAGGRIEIAIAPGDRSVSRAAVRAWAEAAGGAVAGYYGALPVPRVLVIVLPGGRRPVGFGTTLGNGGAAILIWLGRGATEDDLRRDWVLTHEMVHLAFPNVSRDHNWLEEGLATYVEPIARARRGRLPPEEVWRGMLDGMPKGLPQPRDGGLDEGGGIGRRYWGGALFCLLADVEIRERTGNRRSLDDALRGILAAGGNIAVSWDLRRALGAADRAVGVSVLGPLYERMGPRPLGVDLAVLWRRLGVSRGGETVVFDDDAPLAAIRRAITAARPGAAEPPADVSAAGARVSPSASGEACARSPGS